MYDIVYLKQHKNRNPNSCLSVLFPNMYKCPNFFVFYEKIKMAGSDLLEEFERGIFVKSANVLGIKNF